MLWLKGKEHHKWDDWFRLLLDWRNDPEGGNQVHCNIKPDCTYREMSLGKWLSVQMGKFNATDQLKWDLKPHQKQQLQGLIDQGQLLSIAQRVAVPAHDNTQGLKYQRDCLKNGKRPDMTAMLPDGWVVTEHISSTGASIYKRYLGPDGQRAQSVREALKVNAQTAPDARVTDTDGLVWRYDRGHTPDYRSGPARTGCITDEVMREDQPHK